jgi:putative MATE family efflux protein
LKTSITYRQIWVIAFPIIIGSVAQNLLNITDTAFLGRVGQVALGAGAIGGVFYIVAGILAWGFGTGTQIIIARRRGEGDYAEIGRTFQHGFYFQLPLALALFSLMRFFSGDILKFILQSAEVTQATREFINFRSYGIFFASINMLFHGFYVGISRTRIITWTTLVMALVNAVLDYGLIFGNLGLPEMGIGGAALASTIAEGFATVFYILHSLLKLDRKKYLLDRIAKFDDALYRRMIRLSGPVMIQNFISMGAWLAFFLFIEKLGEQALAISNIIRSFYLILMIPLWGFASAASALVSNLIGQNRSNEVVSLVYKTIRLCSMGVLAFVAAGMLFPQFALRIYTNDAQIVEASLPALYVINFAAILYSVAFIVFNAVTGTGKTRVSLMIEMLVIMIYLITAYVLADVFKMKVQVVWMVEILYASLLGIISYFYLLSGKWVSTKV